MNRVALILLGSLVTTACATTQPYEAAGIDYRLPQTDATVTETLTLTSCTPLATDADLTIEPKAGAQPGYYHLAGENLASARIKRDIKVDVSEHGVITGINSSNEDKTPEIVGNVIKTIGSIASTGMAAFWKEDPRQLKLKDEIARLRAVLVNDPRRPGAVKALNAAAAELATLQEGILKVETNAVLELNRPKGANETALTTVDLEFAPFARWFDEPAGTIPGKAHQAALLAAFGLKWKASLKAKGDPTPQPTLPAAKSLRACGFAIVVPAVAGIEVSVTEPGTALPADLEAKKQLPAAQWTDPNKLCLDVGFGEQRDVDLTFNAYGQTTEFHWGSQARAATVSGAIAGYAPDVGGIVTSIKGRSLAAKKAEIDKIDTDQKLQEARRCKRILDAGGDCTASQ